MSPEEFFMYLTIGLIVLAAPWRAAVSADHLAQDTADAAGAVQSAGRRQQKRARLRLEP